MPKMKTKSAAKKRLSKKGSLIKRSKAYRSHLLTKKTSKRKRNLRKGGYICKADASNMRKLLPY